MKYVISSPSRTGSTLLFEIIKSAGCNDILHTHNCFFSVDNCQATTVVFSSRRDLFRSMMSCLIEKRRKTFNCQDNQDLPKIEPFTIECVDYESEFQKQYRWHKWYIPSHNLDKPYHRVETFYLEDFVNNYDFVYKNLNLIQQREVRAPKESQYRYQDVVVNHAQCKEIFDQLESTSEFIPILKPYDPNLPN